MAIAEDGHSSHALSTGGSDSWSHTVATAGATVFLALAVGSGGVAGTTTTATYAGNAMTKIGRRQSGGSTDGFVELWRYDNAPAGASTIAVTSSQTTSTLTSVAISLTGIVTVGSAQSGDSAGAAPTSWTASLTTAVGDTAVIAAASGTGGMAATSPAVGYAQNATSGNGGAANSALAAYKAATSTSTGIAVTMSSDFYSWVGVALTPSGIPLGGYPGTVWDGSAEVPGYWSVWDGTTEVPVSTNEFAP